MLEIPGQNEDVIWFGRVDSLRFIDRNMRPGQETTLFVRAPINRILHEIRRNAAIVQQRVAFGRSTIPDDLFSGLLCIFQKLDELLMFQQLIESSASGELPRRQNRAKAR